MLFNSVDFLIFFPIVVLTCFLVPKKMRYIWLLIASYYFYMSWNPKYALLMMCSTWITYISSILIEICVSKNWVHLKKVCLVGSLLSNLGILGLFKYANFFLENISRIAVVLGIGTIDRRFDLLLPVGISFYTFQALSYTIDVYRGEIKAEKNILKYALFVSFFPQLVAGPIERSKNLLVQIQSIEDIKVWNYERVRDGLLLMMWGLFQKLVIADRAALVVNRVISNYTQYGWIEILIAVILFAFQIYCDFGGYSDIARGAARVMGFNLMRNFNQPYFAQNIKEFWRRWHISLTSWFTEYVYIPLGGNRKGRFIQYVNILIVFGISGLWHGASWNFVAWGLLHAVFQIGEDFKHVNCVKGNTHNRLFVNKLGHMIRVLKTFVLVDFAWIFFVCNSLSHAIGVLRQIIMTINTPPRTSSMGLSTANWCILGMGILVLLSVDVIHEKQISITKTQNSVSVYTKSIVCALFVWSIIMFGIYGVGYDASTFIYFQF